MKRIPKGSFTEALLVHMAKHGARTRKQLLLDFPKKGESSIQSALSALRRRGALKSPPPGGKHGGEWVYIGEPGSIDGDRKVAVAKKALEHANGHATNGQTPPWSFGEALAKFNGLVAQIGIIKAREALDALAVKHGV